MWVLCVAKAGIVRRAAKQFSQPELTWRDLEMLKKTYSPKLAEIEHRWHVLDAAGIPLGRLSSLAARLLMGKHKPTYATHIDTGDFVIVINAEKAVLTGAKEEKKIYYHHTGYPGGIKAETAAKRRQRRPAKMVEDAVWGMLPKGPLGRKQLRKLKVYAGPEHPHQAQQPESFDVAAAL
jgi:large subunit ribosomal protein L13